MAYDDFFIKIAEEFKSKFNASPYVKIKSEGGTAVLYTPDFLKFVMGKLTESVQKNNVIMNNLEKIKVKLINE